MVAFARFVMRDNGLAIHINAQQVTQVRQTTEGEPAIYTLGRDTPMIVEGTLEAAIRKLEAAAAGLRVVEPRQEPMTGAQVEEPTPIARPPALELVAAEPAPATKPAPEPADQPQQAVALAKPGTGKTKPPVKTRSAKVKPDTVKSVKATTAKAMKAKPEPPLEPQTPPYPTASWFMGNR